MGAAFVYEEEGYPDVLELPFQFWLDVIWFDRHGWDSGPQFLDALTGAVDEIADSDLVYGACVGWLRGFLSYAREREVEVTTYTDYASSRARVVGGRGDILREEAGE